LKARSGRPRRDNRRGNKIPTTGGYLGPPGAVENNVRLLDVLRSSAERRREAFTRFGRILPTEELDPDDDGPEGA
jgi:hypothetical protein